MLFTVSDKRYEASLRGATYNPTTHLWTFTVMDSFLTAHKGRGFIFYEIQHTGGGPPILLYREINPVSFWQEFRRRLLRFFVRLITFGRWPS